MKQAVVLIHGIGEQKPMATLRKFVAAVLGPGEKGKEAFWSKPDRMSELFELRRLQTSGRDRTHFYEYYWAYNVEGTKLGAVLWWLVDLIHRPGKDVPKTARSLWLASRVIAVSIVVLAALGIFSRLKEWFAAQPVYGLVWLVAIAALMAVQYFLVAYLGDAARYLSPLPQNIKLRQTIRSEGLQLLRTLHDSRDYDRIIIVGHSLGSVIGYDLLTRLWQEYHDKYPGLQKAETQAALRDAIASGQPAQSIIKDALPDAAKSLNDGSGISNFQREQTMAWREQRRLDNPWKVTDFITIGSPLAHGMLLVAENSDDFYARQRQRELPTCPPQSDEKGFGYSSDFAADIGEGKKFTPLIPHHAALFAVTRWTNIYAPVKWVVLGDFVGGPLREAFGKGIRDVSVRTPGPSLFAHTSYWVDIEEKEGAMSIPNSLAAIRESLELKHIRHFRPLPWDQKDHTDTTVSAST